MESSKVASVMVLLLLLQCNWIQCQYCNGYPGLSYGGGCSCPAITCCDNNKDLDILLPLLILALSNNCGNNSPLNYAVGQGSCQQQGCSCGCGCEKCCNCGCSCGACCKCRC